MKDKMSIMEGYMAIYLPLYLAKTLSTQALEPTIDTALRDAIADDQTWTPTGWRRLLSRLDPQRQYIVTEAAQYKEWPPFPDYQHEYITLTIQPHPSQPQPPEGPVIIKVSRTILGNTISARLGIYGDATDTISILGRTATYRTHHRRLNRLTWTPGEAPLLANVTTLIVLIHRAMPTYHLIKSSCYAFARAVIESVHFAYNGTAMQNGDSLLTRRSYFLGLIPAGATRAQAIAQHLAMAHTETMGHFIYPIYLPIINV